jgi:two-component sensor histidine kinase
MLPDERLAASTPQRAGATALDVRFAVSLPATNDAPRDARRTVVHHLGDLLDARALEDLLVVVSELVTNAVLHGHGDVGLRIAFDGRQIAGTVSEDGHGFTYDPGRPDPAGYGGRGLKLVSRLTTCWGLRQSTSDVWFEMSAGSSS